MDTQMIYIALDTGIFNANNYLFSTKTDKSGNFSFYGLNPDSSYIIFSRPSIASSPSFVAPYLGMTTVHSPFTSSTNFNVVAGLDSPKVNGINIFTQDANQARIGKALVILYTSAVIANADSIMSGSGSLFHLNTDSIGKALVVGLPTGTLYANASVTIDSATSFRTIANPVVLGKTGFISLFLTLK
jgi:hypothetical protein